jgi:acyl-CoA synthetase (AMP-forming)/AMP-acid ligase II
VIEGLMQHDHPLTIRRLVERCETVNASASCITAAVERPRLETSLGVVAGRAHRIAHALASLGVQEGDRVATLMWNSQEHLELYLGVSSSGAVLHTLNLRLLPAQLAWIVNHAEDGVIFVDASLSSLAAQLAPECPTVRHWIVVGGGPGDGLPAPLDYEALLGEQPGDPYPWPDLDDRAAAALCYTSGTTGNPKGVLYSHRSTLLHTLQACMSDTFGVSCRDRILLVVPMFHANAWGLPYAAALVGATLVMPGRDLSATHIAEVIASERATVATGVPTIWYDVTEKVGA